MFYDCRVLFDKVVSVAHKAREHAFMTECIFGDNLEGSHAKDTNVAGEGKQ